MRKLEEVPRFYNFFIGQWVGVPREWWFGIEGIYFIYMGDWSDPLIGYKGYAIDVYDVEDYFWDTYNDEYPAPENFCSPEYREYEEKFGSYIKEQQDEVLGMLDDMIEEAAAVA